MVRVWDHAQGRLGFGLDGDGVTFELHLPGPGLLMRDTPRLFIVALRDILPETVFLALVGKPLEQLAAWPPACGPAHVIASIEQEGGVQVVHVSSEPLAVARG